MGFFSKLFEKKECSICGGEIGLLGNRKLEDGNMCKDCAAKLSPWFSDRRHSTVDEINGQLAYREQNQESLRDFHPTKSIGQYYKMFVEEVGGVPSRFVVTREGNFVEANADILRFSDVSACNIDIQEHSEELKYRNDKNEMVSYNPARYRYQYDFVVELTIANNPYFDEMKFKLNKDSLDIETERFGHLSSSGIGRFLMSNREFDPMSNMEYRDYKQMCDEIEETVAAGQQGTANNQSETQSHSDEQSEQESRPKFCPECGAPVAGRKFCEHCGTKL